jgi:diaphanous 2
LASIKRLVPRLKSISFRQHYNEMVQDIKPVSVLKFKMTIV